MKTMISCTVFLIACMLFLPFLSLPAKTVAASSPVAVTRTKVQTKQGDSARTVESFIVYDKTTDRCTELSARDYMQSVVAAEMPVLYEPEALKAQAVAAYTFALRRQAENRQKPYDITTDPATDQGFMPLADARSCWGEHADEYEQKIRDCVQAVEGLCVRYQNDLALTVYHAVSAGKTESAKTVWGTEIPYLIPVDSAADLLAKNYRSTVTLTAEEIREKLKPYGNLPAQTDRWFTDLQQTASGRVISVCFGDAQLSGEQIRQALQLSSATFTAEPTENGFTFQVCGYGHGVGMSQNGANEMAKQGSTFQEILTHYYVGCRVEPY
ncbi:MAG: stage II sporulation protein D [Clostridia bacterium]|nr:stage II sporulation protein D [Clostridia bacterium]